MLGTTSDVSRDIPTHVWSQRTPCISSRYAKIAFCFKNACNIIRILVVFTTRLPALFGTLMTLCLCTGWVVDYFVVGMSLGTSNDGPGMPRDHPASIPAARDSPGLLSARNAPGTEKPDKSYDFYLIKKNKTIYSFVFFDVYKINEKRLIYCPAHPTAAVRCSGV